MYYLTGLSLYSIQSKFFSYGSGVGRLMPLQILRTFSCFGTWGWVTWTHAFRTPYSDLHMGP